MNQVVKVTSNLRRQQWLSIIRECRNSGQTVRSWCEQNDVHIKSYYYWLRRLREELLEQADLPVLQKPEPLTPFSKLQVNTPPQTQVAVVIHLSGATLEIQNGADRQTVEAVLLALKSVC